MTRLGLHWIALGVALAVLYRQSRLPKLARHPTDMPVDVGHTGLARVAAVAAARHPAHSGVHMLPEGGEAFAARMALADQAERTLDVQYYIWERDMSGTLLLDALRRAADRGVRVRLLLDDNGVAGLDAVLAAFDAHPSIEVRLWNPFVFRRARTIGFALDFARLNRRMHNKSFTADGAATIVGGRNIGDRYFDATRGSLFLDLDVLAIGPVVGQMVDQFERYWCSPSAYPASAILAKVEPEDERRLEADAARTIADPRARDFVGALGHTAFVKELLAHRLDFEWARVRLLSDDPAKTLGPVRSGQLLIAQLRRALGTPTRELGLVSGYFVPSRRAARDFAAMARRGVDVRVVTNALNATDVKVVIAGYAKWRRPLLEAGVRLFEIRGAVAGREPRKRGGRGGWAGGSSKGSALHAKTFTVDGERLFVGSFNLDPRSVHLNTEQGVLIESPALARQVADLLGERLPDIAYELRLGEGGDIEWIERDGGDVVRHDVEPESTRAERAMLWVVSKLPIAWLL